MKNRQAGFNLIELMVAVVLVSILAATALPSYLGQLRKSRRAEAAIALETLAQEQERFFAQFRTYTSVVAAPDGCGGAACGLRQMSNTTENGYYQLVANGNATTYALAATATGPQIKDYDCRTMAINSVGAKVGLSASGEDLTDKCW